MEIKFVHYVGMTFVATDMPQDKPVMCGVVTQNGELRAFWRDSERRGDNKMTLDLFREIGRSMVTGELPMPIFAFIHPDNEQSNRFVAKAGFQMEKVVRDGTEWNAWFLNAERTKVIMGFRKRFAEVASDEERQVVLDKYAENFETAIKGKMGVKVK
jgi:hypothetical protein